MPRPQRTKDSQGMTLVFSQSPSKNEACQDVVNRHRKHVAFHEDVQVVVFLVGHEIRDDFSKTFDLEIVHNRLRNCWHLDGQLCSWTDIQVCLQAPALHSPSLFCADEDTSVSHSIDCTQDVAAFPEPSSTGHSTSDEVPHERIAHGTEHDRVIVSKFYRATQTRSFLEVWFVREHHHHLCIQSRRVEISNVQNDDSLKEKCETAWFELLGYESTMLIWIDPQPRTWHSTQAHVILAQGSFADKRVTMIRGHMLDFGRKHRVVLVNQGETVRDIMLASQFGRACNRPTTWCLLNLPAPQDQETWQGSDIPPLENGQMFDFAIRVQDDTSDSADSSSDDGSTGHVDTDASTQFVEESLSEDETSFMSGAPIHTWQPNPPIIYPWENPEQFIEEEETDTEDLAAAVDTNMIEVTQHFEAIQQENDRSSILLVTFGRALVDLGRRDVQSFATTPEGLIEDVRRLWQDHEQHGQLEAYVVMPQPNLGIVRSHLVFVVGINYHPVRDGSQLALIMQSCTDDAARNRSPYAARLPARATPRALVMALDLEEDLYPTGVREFFVHVRNRLIPHGLVNHFANGDLCEIQIGAIPLHIRHTATWLHNAERFFTEVRVLMDDRDPTHIQCSFHGISPLNRPLGDRILMLPIGSLYQNNWQNLATELWPFIGGQIQYAFVYAEDTRTHTLAPFHLRFHFVISYDVPAFHCPVLIRQAIVALNEYQAQEEQLAINVPFHASDSELLAVLPRHIFWKYPNLAQQIHRHSHSPSDNICPGDIFDIRLHTGSRMDLLRLLLDTHSAHSFEDGTQDDELAYSSLLQLHARQTHFDEFTELCHHLIAQDAYGRCQEGLALKPEDNLNLRKVQASPLKLADLIDGQTAQPISSVDELDSILQQLQRPWIGLNTDFQWVPDGHPMVQFALQSTQQCIAPTHRLHIFTDGSYKPSTKRRDQEEQPETAAWAFVVVAEINWHGARKFCRLGYSAGLVNDGLPPCSLNAANAEATALIAMAEMLLSIQDLHGTQVLCHFDAKNVGLAAFGCQNAPTLKGDTVDRQHCARLMIALIQNQGCKAWPCHVIAHEGNPFNEMSDSIASARRCGSIPPIQPILRCGALLSHPLRDWAWIQLGSGVEIPHLHQLLSPTESLQDQGWADGTFTPAQAARHKASHVTLTLATANVGTLFYGEENHSSSSFKTRELLRQCAAESLDFVGIQESRAKYSQTVCEGDFVRLISAGHNGHAGVELWINQAAFAIKMGSSLDVDKDICVWHSCPRILAATLSHESLTITIIVCYAPQSGRSLAEIDAWWQEFDSIIDKRPVEREAAMVWLGDMNAKIGSVTSTGIGPLAGDLEDHAGQHLRLIVDKHNMLVPSTFDAWHQGQSWTFLAGLGHRSRIDFIAISEQMTSGVHKSFVNTTLDLMNGDHDHLPVCLVIQMVGHCNSHAGFQRKVLYDRNRARANKQTQGYDPFDDLPVIPWKEGLNAHWSTMRDVLQQHMVKWYPKPKRQKRQLYMSQTCWDILCHRKDITNLMREMDREFRACTLHMVLQVWKHGVLQDARTTLTRHQMRMQFALALHMRVQLDSHFRKQKVHEWKHWVADIAQSNRLAVQQGGDIYKILQPKKMIARAAGKHKRQLPGYRQQDGTWVHSKHTIALAWQAQFASIENADASDMHCMIQQSQPQDVQHAVDDLQDIPTLFELEAAIRQLSDLKAPGVDSLGAEVFQVSISAAARRVYPILLKSALRKQAVPEFGGGWLLPLWKGKGQMAFMPNHRGILLEPVLGRALSRSWRGRLERAMATHAAIMQWGGRKGLAIEGLHLQTRLWCSNAKASRQAISIIYVDIRSAFYSVAKELLTGCQSSKHDAKEIAHRLRIPDTAQDTFLDHLHNADLLRRYTGSHVISDSVTATLQQTWYIIPNGDAVQAPTTGSRPGDPNADLLYGMIMSELLQVLHGRLEEAGIWDHIPRPNDPHPLNVTWVDDTAFAVYGHCDNIVQLTLHAMGLIIDTALEFGLHLSYGTGKTSIMTAFHGHGAIEARQRFEANFKHDVPVVTEHQGVVRVPLTNHYKHLGGIVVKDNVLLPEIRVRAAVVASRIKPLRKVMSDVHIDIRKRRTLVKSMGLSVATLHSGTWFDLGLGDFKTWQGMIHRLYSALQPSHDNAHMNAYQLARDADSPLPMELLHIHRLRLFIHIVHVADDLVFQAILCNFQIAKDASWLACLQYSCQWWKDQIGVEDLPTHLDTLHDFQSWRLLKQDVPHLKKLLKHAQRAHMIRITTLCELQAHAVFQKQVLQDMGFCLNVEDPAQLEADIAVPCPQCGKTFSTHAALAVHQSRQHGWKMALRRYACDSVCRVCARNFHTRNRLLNHWHSGSTPCWRAVFRAYVPMAQAEADALDIQDKDNHAAHHQRGLKAWGIDKQWCHATHDQLQHVLACQPTFEAWDVSDPSPVELTRWGQYGTLPTGKGGKPKTVRKQSAFDLRHVQHDTHQFEADMHARARQWLPNDEFVPPALAEDVVYALILFSGHRRWADLGSWLSWEGSIRPLCIDLAIDSCFGNVLHDAHWINLIRSGRVVAGHAGPPCETYSLARWLEWADSIFPRPLRTGQDPWGRYQRNLREITQCAMGTTLMLQALKLLLLIHLHGGCWTLEHPKGPSDAQTQWSIWLSGFVAEIRTISEVDLLTMMQGPLGQPFAKPTCLLYGRLASLPHRIYSHYDRKWRPSTTLGGRDSHGWKTAAAKVYPPRLCKALAEAYIDFAQTATYEAKPAPSAEAEQAILAITSKWDPYLEDAVGTTMAADYHSSARKPSA